VPHAQEMTELCLKEAQSKLSNKNLFCVYNNDDSVDELMVKPWNNPQVVAGMSSLPQRGGPSLHSSKRRED
jgi:hypothetical protein